MPTSRTALARRWMLPLSLALAFSLQPQPRARGQSPQDPSNPDAPIPADEQVVRMEAFNVGTTVGRYHEEMSSMAAKIPTSLKELASSLQILNASAIKDRNAITLQDLYSYIIGIGQVSPSSNGFTFRGFSNTGSFTQNIEYDGLMGGTSNHGGISSANIEQIEFLKGPNSVLYGQMHPGGLLNIVTKSPKREHATTLFGAVSTYAGTYNSFGRTNSYVATIDDTGPIDKARHWLYRIVANAQDLHPFRNFSYERDLFLYPSLTYEWSTQDYFTVKLEYIQTKQFSDDGMLPIIPNNPYSLAPLNTVYQEPSDTSRDNGESLSTAFHAVWNENWTLRVQTRLTWHTDAVRELNSTGSPIIPAVPYQNSTLQRVYGYTVNGHRYNFFDANFFGTVGPDRFRNTVLVGVGGGQEFFDNHRYANGPSVPAINLYSPVLGFTPYPADGTKTINRKNLLDSLGAYASDQMRIGERLHLSGGVRYDQQESHGMDAINPKTLPYLHQFVTAVTSQAGAVYDLTKTLSVYGSWSQSFVPTAVTNVDATGQAGFPPEKGEQIEAGLKFETPDKNLFASFAAYRLTRTNVAVASGLTIPSTGQPIFRLDGQQQSKGFEFETEWRPVPYWQIQAGAAYIQATITQSTRSPISLGRDLPNAPRATGNFWTRYNVPNGSLKGFGVGCGVIYTGRSWAGDPTGSNYYPIAGWTRVDGALYYKWSRYELSLNLQNALDRKYVLAAQSGTGLFPGDERKLTLSATARF